MMIASIVNGYLALCPKGDQFAPKSKMQKLSDSKQICCIF